MNLVNPTATAKVISLYTGKSHTAARALAECLLLSGSWKDGLWLRAQKTTNPM